VTQNERAQVRALLREKLANQVTTEEDEGGLRVCVHPDLAHDHGFAGTASR
jgi:hypothetical protein